MSFNNEIIGTLNREQKSDLCKKFYWYRFSNRNPVIIDIGAHVGTFVSEMLHRHSNCKVYAYEPLSQYHNVLSEKYREDKRVVLNRQGILDRNETVYVEMRGPESTIFCSKTPYRAFEKCFFVNIVSVLKSIGNVDLMKLNVEGSEYCILQKILESNLQSSIDYFLIQFHRGYVINPEEQRKHIVDKLSKTHQLVWDFPWVWECWKRLSLKKDFRCCSRRK